MDVTVTDAELACATRHARARLSPAETVAINVALLRSGNRLQLLLKQFATTPTEREVTFAAFPSGAYNGAAITSSL